MSTKRFTTDSAKYLHDLGMSADECRATMRAAEAAAAGNPAAFTFDGGRGVVAPASDGGIEVTDPGASEPTYSIARRDLRAYARSLGRLLKRTERDWTDVPLAADEAAALVTAMHEVSDGRRRARSFVLGENRGRFTVIRQAGRVGLVFQPEAGGVIYLGR